MISELGRQHGTVAPRAVGLCVAAIVLVLHWAAPSVRPFNVAIEARGATSGLFSATPAAQRGHLPRAQPRIASVESAFPKPERSKSQTGGKFYGITQCLDWAVRFVESSVPTPAGFAAPRTRPVLAFNARAPPPLQV